MNNLFIIIPSSMFVLFCFFGYLNHRSNDPERRFKSANESLKLELWNDFAMKEGNPEYFKGLNPISYKKALEKRYIPDRILEENRAMIIDWLGKRKPVNYDYYKYVYFDDGKYYKNGVKGDQRRNSPQLYKTNNNTDIGCFTSDDVSGFCDSGDSGGSCGD